MTRLAQGRYWQASARQGSEVVGVALLRDELPEGFGELQLEVPFARWNAVMRRARSDRKLLGGLLLEHARNKDQLAVALAAARLYGELQRVLVEASASLVEEGLLALTPAGEPESLSEA